MNKPITYKTEMTDKEVQEIEEAHNELIEEMSALYEELTSNNQNQ